LPMSDSAESTRMIFYKETKDSLFVSTKGEHFYIIDGVLYLRFYTDHGNEGNSRLVAVKVPDDIGNYFIEFMGRII